MAHINKVLVSIETDDGGRCVDLFRRPDGSFGFEEYRRDVEDGQGWFAIGSFGDRRFESEVLAKTAALNVVTWLSRFWPKD